ncbi:RNA polymerase sigma factor [Chitinophaga sp. Cy-1792]|uniref:RNA polymerase sigma factor n=1 Tax=Chitinophaga sp. Cy-1792 TaxID=2608339 RepID=UPI0014220158|nr:sigma-70 family RNA polymerase sigma factor [Chitinophaga sp. Cy-1792]NIG53755.1 sigma-70 family RNA polymerase sigma factor [Chitinophaga sp. Cy-1792]
MDNEVGLLRALAEGDRSAYTSLYYHYQPKLYRYLLPFTVDIHLVEEITQDIFVKVWLKRETFVGIERFEYYLYRMGRNRLLDIFRQQQKLLLSETLPDTGFHPEQEQQYREYNKLAQEAIQRMPERRRIIFELSTQQDLSWAEIAERQQVSVAVVKKQLHLASSFIRSYIRKYGEINITLVILLYIFFY